MIVFVFMFVCARCVFVHVCVRVYVCVCFSYIDPTIKKPELFVNVKKFRRDFNGDNAYYYIQHICSKSGNIHRYPGNIGSGIIVPGNIVLTLHDLFSFIALH